VNIAAVSNTNPHHDAPLLWAGTPLEQARLVIILLHGRGASARDILSIADVLGRAGVAFVAPQASSFSWYPQPFLAEIEANEPWLSSAHELIESIMAECAARGLSGERCGLVGFSQGGCLAVDHAARYPRRWGLVAAFTGGLIGPPGASFDFNGSLDGTPAFLGANDPDPHVPWARVTESVEVLARMGAQVDLQRYPNAGHTINADEIERTRLLLDQVLADLEP
jgi:predicted esterase